MVFMKKIDDNGRLVIPRDLLQQLGVKLGDTVSIDISANKTGIIIRAVPKQKNK